MLHINFNDTEDEKEAQKRKMWEDAVRRHGYKDLDDYNARHEEVERKAYEEWMKLPFEERCKQYLDFSPRVCIQQARGFFCACVGVS